MTTWWKCSHSLIRRDFSWSTSRIWLRYTRSCSFPFYVYKYSLILIHDKPKPRYARFRLEYRHRRSRSARPIHRPLARPTIQPCAAAGSASGRPSAQSKVHQNSVSRLQPDFKYIDFTKFTVITAFYSISEQELASGLGSGHLSLLHPKAENIKFRNFAILTEV